MANNNPLDDVTAQTSGGKFFQIVVPDFGTTPATTFTKVGSSYVRDATTVSMTSFLRLGMFATGTEPGAFAGQLLDAIDAASPPNPSAGRAAAAAAAARASLAAASVANADVIAMEALKALGANGDADLAAAFKAAAEGQLDATKTAAQQLDAMVQAVSDLASAVPFIDDERNRGNNDTMDPPNGHRLSVAERIKESQRLLSKGGWRDHSDGNRISTTYGDKVEVVRGNYRMIVLGRQDDPTMGAVSDVSGGLFDNADIGPGSIAEIKWVQSQDGTWRSIETAAKADCESFFNGHVRETFLGGSVSSITGREDADAVQMAEISSGMLADLQAEFAALPSKDEHLFFDQYALQRGYVRNGEKYYEARYEEYSDTNSRSKRNPLVFERTWAASITEYTGSTANPVPSIYSETNAKEMKEYTYATSQTSYTSVTGTIEETTLADTITSTTGSSSSRVSSVTETTYAKTLTEKLGDWGVKIDTVSEETHTHERHCLWEGVNSECNLGLFAEMFLGAAFSLRVGVPTIELSIGAAAEIFLGASLEVFAGAKIEIDQGIGLELGEMKTYLKGCVEKVELEQTHISTLISKMAAIQNLGP